MIRIRPGVFHYEHPAGSPRVPHPAPGSLHPHQDTAGREELHQGLPLHGGQVQHTPDRSVRTGATYSRQVSYDRFYILQTGQLGQVQHTPDRSGRTGAYSRQVS